MKAMRIIDGMKYNQWQKRNTQIFKKLSTEQKQDVRKQGYFNMGWEKIKSSWEILSSSIEAPSFFDIKLKKGDFSGAIDQCILGAEQFHRISQAAIEELKHDHNALNKLAQTTLDKYQLL
jgi:hypothetical protein